MLRTHSLRGHVAFASTAQPVPVARVALADQPADDSTGLHGGALAGVVVGSVLGGALFIILVGLLIRCLCQRRKISADQAKVETTNSGTKAPSSSVWSCFGKRRFTSSRGRRVPPPIFGSDKQDPDDISDTSFVLPELGGPNPTTSSMGWSGWTSRDSTTTTCRTSVQISGSTHKGSSVGEQVHLLSPY